jgi:hypothetical protein
VTSLIREDEMAADNQAPVDDMDSTENDKNDPITPVVKRRADPGSRSVPPKTHGFIAKSLMEPNGETPSSARIIAAFIFGSLTVLTFLIILVLLFRIMTIQDPYLGGALLSTLTKITLYWFLFFAATALSLYGINVWKYVAGMRMGFDNSIDPTMGGMNGPQGNRFGGQQQGVMGGYGGGNYGGGNYGGGNYGGGNYGSPQMGGQGSRSPYVSPQAPPSPGPAPGTPAAVKYRRTAPSTLATITKDDPLPSKTDEN